ncbi:MAG TPA: hypothetical protein VGB53_03340 [Rubricoccaceae bacterium]
MHAVHEYGLTFGSWLHAVPLHRPTKFYRDERGNQVEAERQKRRAAAQKGAHTRTKKRIAAGVCPCCNRTFQDLARHMAG